MIRIPYFVHIVTAALGLISGYIALYVSKGAALHRRAGMVFVYSMLTMTAAGSVSAVLRNAAPVLNVPAGVITFYLVLTGFTTLRPPSAGGRGISVGAMLVALAIGVVELTIGGAAVRNGGTWGGYPAFPFLLFGTVGILASVGDFRVLTRGALEGTRRVARHLWRMTFALLIAAMSFFFGQAKVIPRPIRIPALLALPVVAVLVTLIYWMWRINVRKTLRAIHLRNSLEFRGGVELRGALPQRKQS